MFSNKFRNIFVAKTMFSYFITCFQQEKQPVDLKSRRSTGTSSSRIQIHFRSILSNFLRNIIYFVCKFLADIYGHSVNRGEAIG